MPSPKSSFLDKVLGRIDRLDKEGLQTVVQRLARERSFLEMLFNTIEDGVLVVDTEGTSVLTAFASDKLNADKVTVMLKEENGLKDKVTHKRIIIPGLVAAMAAKLKDASGWEVLVGPRESSGIPKFLKSMPGA